MLRNALRTRYALIVALALYIACTAAWAGQLTGKVTDDAGVGLLARVTVIQYESRNSAVGFTLPDGTFSLDVPDGELSVLAAHGPEWSIAEVTAHAGDVLNLVLHRLVDMPSYGYYGADLHMHSTFSDGTQPVEVMASACRAEGLHIAALTDHDTVDQHGLWLQQATPDFLPLRGQEITTSTMGHFLGINGPTLVSRDVSGGEEDIRRIFRQVREDGGISIVAHPCVPTMNYQTPDIMDYDALEILNGSMAPYGPLFDVVQGRKMWHALLSKGHRIAAVGDSDCHDVTSGRARRMLKDPAAAIRSDKRIGMIAMLVDFKTVIEPWGWKGLHVGTYRTYLHLDAVTPQDVQAAVQAGRGFVTNGPLLVATLDGELPGSEVTIGDRPKLTLAAELVANRPLQRLDVLVNGEVAMSVQPADSQVNLEVPVKAGDWVTAELFGPWPEFATTNAWYVR